MRAKYLNIMILASAAIFLVTGCSHAAAATVPAGNNLFSPTRLAVGTLKLEDSDQAVTTSQASYLLTLWQGYQSLGTSYTTSQVELGALLMQIESAMTTEQIKTINAMDITEQTVSEVLKSEAPAEITATATTNGATQGQIAPSGAPGWPGGLGGMPGSDDSMMSEIGTGVTIQSTPSAAQPAAQSSQVDAWVLTALIQLLETRSQAGG